MNVRKFCIVVAAEVVVVASSAALMIMLLVLSSSIIIRNLNPDGNYSTWGKHASGPGDEVL